MRRLKILEKIIKTLKERKLTISIAESCTGGYVSYLLTKISGSSNVFKGGLVIYSSEAKNTFLKIPIRLLKKTQGVSKQVCLVLAKNVKKSLKTDIGASVVGFAGPKAKKGIKIGTILIGISDKKGTVIKKVVIKGTRNAVRKKASNYLIELLYKRVK